MSLPDLSGESGFSLLTLYHIFCLSFYMIYLVVFLFPNRPLPECKICAGILLFCATLAYSCHLPAAGQGVSPVCLLT